MAIYTVIAAGIEIAAPMESGAAWLRSNGPGHDQGNRMQHVLGVVYCANGAGEEPVGNVGRCTQQR